MSVSDSATGAFSHHETEQLLREVFRPVLSRHHNPTGSKREWPPAPRSTLKKSSRMELQPCTPPRPPKRFKDDSTSTIITTPPRPPKRFKEDSTSTIITEQQLLVRSVTDIATSEWNLMAACLSCGVWQAHGTLHTHMIPCDTCLCIACAGMKAKPIRTPCLVCGASIPYSVCLKLKNAAQAPVPSMCFKCNCAFLSP
jgi:hypothetical protein